MVYYFTFYTSPTSDRYKRGGVAVWRRGGWGRKEKRRGELVSSEKVVYLQVENNNADENRNSENS